MIHLSRCVLLPIYSPISWSYNPNRAVTWLVWALPRSLATTCGITIVFFSYGYLDVSVPRVRLLLRAWLAFNQPGCPIRKSPDQRLFAPPRSLSQLVTSFFASESLGIHHTLLVTFLTYLLIGALAPAKIVNAFFHHVNELFVGFPFPLSYSRLVNEQKLPGSLYYSEALFSYSGCRLLGFSQRKI